MRNIGIVLLGLGILGFVYTGDRLAESEPVPPGSTVMESLRYDSGRWEVARWGCGVAAGFGLLMGLFPKGR